MKNKRKGIFLFIIICAIILAQLMPATTALAANLSDTLSLITKVSLTDIKGNPLGENISKSSDLKLTYEYAIPNTASVKEGDTFTLHIPQEIAITAPGSFDLVDSVSGQVIGNGTIATDGTLVITFTHFVEVYSDIHGSFWFDLAFNADKIGNQDPYNITFNVGASSAPFKIEVNFDQPEAPKPTIVKSGSYNAATKQVTWTLTVDPENVEVDNAVVTDTIAEGQKFADGTLSVNGSPADPSNYSFDTGTAKLTYTFPGTIFTKQVLTFKTTVQDSEFSNSTEGATLSEHNTASLAYDGGGATSNDATISTTVDFINKSGTYDSTNKKINWSITIDNNYVTIPDAVITDTIPTGLTLDTDTVYRDGTTKLVSGTDFTYDAATQKLVYHFPSSISEPHTITYSTDVAAAFYETNNAQTFTNSVNITGTGVPTGASASRGIGVTSTIVNKSGTGYSASTGQITWLITVNSNKIYIKGCYATDDILIGQEFVPGSVYIDGILATEGSGYTYTKASAGDTTNTGSLLFSIGDTSVTHTIEFKTQITDPDVYMSNAGATYYNTAKAGGSEIPVSTKQNKIDITSEVINKTGIDYNYDTREATWKIVIDKNQMPLSGVIITDDIKTGQEFVEGSVTYDGSPALPANYNYTQISGDSNKTGTLVYNAGAISDQHIITFKTHITDLSIFGTNGDKTIQNSAKLIHSLITKEASSTGNRTIHNTVISKTGDYTNGNKYIDWTVIINTNTIPLSNAVITDVLQQGLQLDTASITLYHMNVNADGTLAKGNEVVLGTGNVVYDYVTRTLNFTIPSPVTGSYELTFRTNVTDKTKSPFTNSASFMGTGSKQVGQSGSIAVAWSGSGSSGTGQVGSIRVYKVDSHDNKITLPGCTFDLFDRYGNKLSEQTTGQDGSVLFDMLRFDVNYTVKEVSPPQYYLLSNEAYTFQIHGSDASHDINYRYADEKMKGSIKLYKFDLGMKPIPGTGFTLYDSGNNTVATATSDINGLVIFSNIPYGDYTIKETSPAEGYAGSTAVLSASVYQNGDPVMTKPGYIQDGRIYGNITMLKTASDGTTALPGATFDLYESNDTGFKSSVATAVSDDKGTVLFKNILYGSYVIRETAAPSDYAISSTKISVAVVKDGVTVDAGTFTDKLQTHDLSPQTGDDIDLYIVLFILCAAGITAIILAPGLLKRLKKQRNTK